MYIVNRRKSSSPAQITSRRVECCTVNIILDIKGNGRGITRQATRHRHSSGLCYLCHHCIDGTRRYVYRLTQYVRRLITLSGRTRPNFVPLHFFINIRNHGDASLFLRIREVFDVYRLVPYIQQVILICRGPDSGARAGIGDGKSMNFVSHTLGSILHVWRQTCCAGIVDINPDTLLQRI